MANDKFNPNILLSPKELFNIKPALLKTKNIKTPCCICFAFKKHTDFEQGGKPSDPNNNTNERNKTNPIFLTCINCGFHCHRSCLPFRESPKKETTGAFWVCSFCEENGAFSKKCAVCPVQWGPLLSLNEKIQLHPACVLWIPELYANISAAVFCVAGWLDIIKDRFVNVNCCFCENTHGACIPCSFEQCTETFHPLCGFINGVEFDIKKVLSLKLVRNGINFGFDANQNKTAWAFVSLCPKHNAVEFDAAKHFSKLKITFKDAQKDFKDFLKLSNVSEFDLIKVIHPNFKTVDGKEKTLFSSVWRNLDEFFGPDRLLNGLIRLVPDSTQFFAQNEKISPFLLKSNFLKLKLGLSHPNSLKRLKADLTVESKAPIKQNFRCKCLFCRNLFPISLKNAGNQFSAVKTLVSVFKTLFGDQKERKRGNGAKIGKKRESERIRLSSAKKTAKTDKVPVERLAAEGERAADKISEIVNSFLKRVSGGEDMMASCALKDNSLCGQRRVFVRILDKPKTLKITSNFNLISEKLILREFRQTPIFSPKNTQKSEKSQNSSDKNSPRRIQPRRVPVNPNALVPLPSSDAKSKPRSNSDVVGDELKKLKSLLAAQVKDNDAAKFELLCALETGLRDFDLIFDEKREFGLIAVLAHETRIKQILKNSSRAFSAYENLSADSEFFQSDRACQICFYKGGDDPNGNLLCCQLCNIVVHLSCYGAKKWNSDNEWLCDKCRIYKEQSESYVYQCVYCPIKGGALKQCSNGDFVHVPCLFLIASAEIGNMFDLSPIYLSGDKFDQIKNYPICSVCKFGIKYGNPDRFKCSHSRKIKLSFSKNSKIKSVLFRFAKSCKKTYHPLCAWYAGHYIKKPGGLGSIEIKCFKHAPFDFKKRAKRDISKARKYTKTWERAVACPLLKPLKKPVYSEKQVRKAETGSTLKPKILSAKTGRTEPARPKRDREPGRGPKAVLEPLAKKIKVEQDLQRDWDTDLVFDRYPADLCAVCFSGAQSQNILICQFCYVRIHPDCYGVQLAKSVPQTADIAPIKWLCSLCSSGRRSTRSKSLFPPCALCGRIGGALKPTAEGEWAHAACALWLPEIEFGSAAAMEPVLHVPRAAFRRYSRCAFCKRVGGACVQCSTECDAMYHPICALFNGLYVKVVEIKTNNFKILSLCHKHGPSNNKNSQSDLKVDIDWSASRQKSDKNDIENDFFAKVKKIKNGNKAARLALITAFDEKID